VLSRIEGIILIFLNEKFKKTLGNLSIVLFVFLLALIDLFYRSGSITKRMATASSDDNPIVYSLVRRFPDRYELDFYARVIADTQQNSIVSRIIHPILSSNILNEQSLWASLVMFQRVFLYFAVFVFISTFITSRIQIAFVLSIFASGSVYYWNLGWFGALDDQPYPMWMAVPSAILGVAFLKKGHYKKLHLSVLFTTLIHPSIGLMFAGWIVFYMISSKHLKRSVEFLINAFLNLIYILISRVYMPDQAEMPQATREIALTNPHLNFFNVFTTDYTFSSVRIWILIICFSILAILHEREYLSFKRNHLIFSMVIYSILLLILQFFGLVTNQLLIISLVPARFTVMLITISFLLVMIKLSQDLQSKELLKRISALLTIIFPAPILMFFLLIRDSPRVFMKKHRKIICRTSQSLTIGLIAFLVAPTILAKFGFDIANRIYASEPYNSILNPLRTGFMNFIVPSLFSNTKIQLLFILLFAIMLISPQQAKSVIVWLAAKINFANMTWKKIVYVILTASFLLASKTGMQYQLPWSYNGVNQEKVSSYTATQTWARLNTEADAVFFIDGSMPPYYTWRTLSQRAVSNPNPIWSLYNYPEYADIYNKSRESFWSSSLETKKLDYYGQWDEKYFCLSQDLMNISYVVQNLKQRALKFPIVYENEYFKVFKVGCKP
jgi:hypothetical protein